MKKRFSKIKALSWQERQLFCTAMILLPLTALVLHLFGFKRTQAFLSRFIHADRGMNLPEVNSLQEARIIDRMVGVAARHGIYRANCLKQSLVLWWLLARRGIVSEIRIGVQKGQAEPLTAHAWVECGGQTLIDSEYIRQQFSVFEIN